MRRCRRARGRDAHATLTAFAAFSLISVAAIAFAQNARTNAPATNPSRPPDYRERYSVLAEHNIFTRERGRSNRPGPATRSTPQATPEQSYVLTGVVLESGERRAYFDDRANQTNIKLGRGEKLARGTIAEIDIDAITFEAADGKRSRVEIGNDLTGSAVVVKSADGATSQPAIDPNNPNLTLEEKMKLRRMKESK